MSDITHLIVLVTAAFGLINGMILIFMMKMGIGNQRHRTRALGTCVCMILYAMFMAQGMHVSALLMASVTFVLNLATLMFPGEPVQKTKPDRTAPVGRNLHHDIQRMAAAEVPDLSQPLALALSRIESFRLVAGESLDPETSTVEAMIDERIPSLVSGYRSSLDAANDDERRMMAATVIEAIIDIGEAAERHRAAAIARRQDSMTTEARFISERLGSDDADRLLGRS